MFGKNIASIPSNTMYSTQNVETLKTRITELENLVASLSVSSRLCMKLMLQIAACTVDMYVYYSTGLMNLMIYIPAIIIIAIYT